MVRKDDVESKLVETLNEGQRKAFFEILEFFVNPGSYNAFVLKGYAGTGKTYLIKKIVEWVNLVQKNTRIAITAPTNKAVQVLYTLGEFEQTSHVEHAKGLFDIDRTVSSISYSTIHKLLGLTETITAKGEQKFTAKKNDKNEILKYKILIVDETSMLDDSLCHEILQFDKEVRILFSGDPAQIPPINRQDCIPFSENHRYCFKKAELKEIMRQKSDNPIIEASFVIRNNLTAVQPIPMISTKINEKGCGIIHLDSAKDRDKVRPLLNEYFNCPAFEQNANYAKVIAWRNKTVDYMNSTIRELLYGQNIPKYVFGEKLICNKPIFENNNIILNNSEELTVVEVITKQMTFYEKSYSLKAGVYLITVEVFDPTNKEMREEQIVVIDEESKPAYDALLAKVKETAIAKGIKDIWVSYYNIEKWSADVKYNYAITAHKSQGSSYTNVFLLEEDMDHNKKTVERNRIKYTSYSRPTDKLFILRHNYGKTS